MTTPLDTISEPVRLRIVRQLGEHGSATLAALAEGAGVHLNTVRAHAAALEEAGLIVRERATPSGRGRPAVRFRLSEGWTPPTTDFRGLAELLSAALLRSGPSPAHLRAVGFDWGCILARGPGDRDLRRELPLALARLGFDAELEGDVLRLTSCPCALVAPDRPEVVCRLAAAVADGVLAGARTGLHVAIRSHDPERRACSLALQGAGR
jgi:DNA-binding transcriptional ArsR family regulator